MRSFETSLEHGSALDVFVALMGSKQLTTRCNRTPRDSADTIVLEHWHHLALLLAVKRRVLILHRDERRQPIVERIRWIISGIQDTTTKLVARKEPQTHSA